MGRMSTLKSVRTDEIAQLGPWFHNLHLPDGRQTAPDHRLGDFPTVKWNQIAPYIAEDLSGASVLDIGCNAGYYSFEFARRGAQVTAIDVDPHYLRQACWAARHFGLQRNIEFRRASVYSLARGPETFDVVLFLGVLYHLRHPLLALDLLRDVTNRQLVVQTLTMPGEAVASTPENVDLFDRERLRQPGWPCMAFIERQLANDPTNWWAPNHACVEAMLRSAGFTITARPGHEIYVAEPNPADTGVNRDLRVSELAAVLRPESLQLSAERGES
jgi:tRNA (mo5U34)-methyltransferase